ncbi:MAG: alpha/beta fold hydrolase [Anaerolineae bacterium]
MNDQILADNFYHTVDMFLQLLGAEQVSRTDIFFRLSRAAIGTNIDYSEIQRIVARIKSLRTWYNAWQQSADHFAGLAEQAETQGHHITAGEHYLRAALLYHFAQLFTRPEDSHRIEGQKRRVAYYRKACPYLHPAVEPVEITFGEIRLPGYLRRPMGIETPPVVLMIPGANSVKEELHNWGEELVKRGMATLAFDGPGQGELAARHGGPPLRFETYHRAVSTVIDYLETRPDIDPKRLAAWGQSTGGQLAIRAAAHDSRITTVVSLGGGYDFRLEMAPTTPADVREEGRDLHGFTSFAEAEAYIRQYGSLQGVVNKLRCPLLLIHGGQDNIVALEELEQIQQEAASPTQLKIYEDGNHSVCNRNLEMSAFMADWLADQLI